MNHQIKASEVRVITSEGENLGVMKTHEAIKEAQNRDRDLLLVVPNANPPVAKIVEFSKFLYEERKKQSSAKVKSKKIDIKEFRMGPTTGQGDIDRFIYRGRGFLEEGNKVKITVKMRGRQQMHPEVAFDKVKIFEKGYGDIAKLEAAPKRVGNMVWAMFSPK
ncbi:translation initiation factor IF-3 [Patescibacteria group bacterium]